VVVNVSSTLGTHAVPLASVTRYGLRMTKAGGEAMDGRARLILALIMSGVMVLMVTLLVTSLNLGLRADFLIQWAKAYLIAWPVAAATAFVIMPAARRLTERIIARLDGKH